MLQPIGSVLYMVAETFRQILRLPRSLYARTRAALAGDHVQGQRLRAVGIMLVLALIAGQLAAAGRHRFPFWSAAYIGVLSLLPFRMWWVVVDTFLDGEDGDILEGVALAVLTAAVGLAVALFA